MSRFDQAYSQDMDATVQAGHRHRFRPWLLVRLASVILTAWFAFCSAHVFRAIIASLGGKTFLWPGGIGSLYRLLVPGAFAALALTVAGTALGVAADRRKEHGRAWRVSLVLCLVALLLDACMIAESYYAIAHSNCCMMR